MWIVDLVYEWSVIALISVIALFVVSHVPDRPAKSSAERPADCKCCTCCKCCVEKE
jgi:hypothetical protein